MNKCLICNDCYEKPSSLSDHLAKTHNFKPTFCCPVCGHNSPSILALRRHKNQIHGNKNVIENETEQMDIEENDHFANNQVSFHILSKH